MASVLNMSETNYGKIERNEIDISEENLERVSKELDVSVEFLKNFREDMLFAKNDNFQGDNASYNFSIHEKSIEILESTVKTLQEEIVYLRRINERLMEKVLL